MVPIRVLKKMARSELPTTTYMGSPRTIVISGTMNGPPPKPNMDDTIAIKNPPIQPTTIFILNS